MLSRLWIAAVFLVMGVLPAALLIAWRPSVALSLAGAALMVAAEAALIGALLVAWLDHRPALAALLGVVAVGLLVGAIVVGNAIGPPFWPVRRFTGRFAIGGVALFWFLLCLKPANDQLTWIIHRIRARRTGPPA